MLIEFASVGVALSALIFPGWFVCKKLNLLHHTGSLGLVLLFSLIIVGAVQYGMSFIWPHPNAYLLLATLFSLIGILFSRNNHEPERRRPFLLPKTKQIHNVIVGVGIVLIAVHLSGIVSQYESNSFDDLSYHLPFIQSYAEKGNVPSIQDPQNEYENRVNKYPKFFETIVGSVHSLSPAVSAQIPVVVWITFAFLVFFVTTQLNHSSLAGVLITGASTMVLPIWISYFVEGFLGVILLGIVALLLIEKKHAVMIGLLAGALIATKLTSPLYFLSLILTLLLVYRDEVYQVGPFFLVGLFVGGGYEMRLWAEAIISHFSPHVTDIIESGSQFGDTIHSIKSIIAGIQLYFFDSIIIAIFLTGLFLIFWGRTVTSIDERRKWITILGMCGLPIILYFGMALVFQTTYFGSFFRYLIPAFMVGSVIPSIQWSRMVNRIGVRNQIMAGGATTILLIVCLVPTVSSLDRYADIRESGTSSMDITMNTLRSIPPESIIFFANTPNPLTWGLGDKKILDHTTYPILEQPVCEKLQEEGVTHVFVFYPTRDRPELGSTNQSVVNATREGDCGKRLEEKGTFYWLYKLTE